MITEEHLNHWIKEIDYQLNGITMEIGETKLGVAKNVIINDNNVSFEYLREKNSTARQLLKSIMWDMEHDK